MLLPLFCYLLKVLQCPADKSGNMGHEGLTAGSEAVLHSRRHFGINLAVNQPDLFKAFERLRQHFLRAVRHVTPHVVKTKRAVLIQMV